MSFSPRFLLPLVLLLALLGVAIAGPHLDLSKGRLVLSKTDSNILAVHDLDDPDMANVASIPDVDTRAAVYATSDGFFSVVVHRNLGRVRLLNSGISYNEAGNAIVKTTPSYVQFQAIGTLPAHVNSEFNWIMVKFDGSRPLNISSQIFGIRERQLNLPNPQVLEFPSDGPHHGVAIAAKGCHFILTEANPDFVNFKVNSSLPHTFRIYDLHKKVVTRFENVCAGYHGSAANGNYHAFGCNDGGFSIITYNPTTKAFSHRKLPYPDGTTLRSGTVISHPSLNFFIANYGGNGVPYDRLVKFTTTQTTIAPTDILTFPEELPACQFTLSQRDGSKLIVLHTTGKVLFYNSNTLESLGSFDLPYNFTCGDVGRPDIALGVDHVYVSWVDSSVSPAVFKISEVAISNYQQVRVTEVPYRVHRMAVTGVYVAHNEDDQAASCDPDDGHDHDHDDDDHDHDHDDDDHDHDHDHSSAQGLLPSFLLASAFSAALMFFARY